MTGRQGEAARRHTVAPPTGPAHPRAILAIILVSYLLILVDNSVVLTALPSIGSSLDLGPTGLSWVQNAYLLVFGGLLLLGARLSDLLGRRPVFVVGLLVFVTSSFLVGTATAGWWLVAARALQGVGAAIVAPTALLLLTATFAEGPARTRALAWYAGTTGIGASVGLLIGGALTEWVSWRAGFFVNVPVGIALVLLAPRYLPASSPQPGRFDIGGAVGTTVGVGALVLGVISSAEHGWGSPIVVGSLALSAVTLVLLVLNERRASQPIMPLRLFADRRRSGAYAARALYLGAMMGFFFFTTQLMQDVLGFTALQAGLGFLPMTAVSGAVVVLLPGLVRRLGAAWVLVIGVGLALVGLAWLSTVGADSRYLDDLAMPMVLIGLGQGLAFALLTSFGIVGVRSQDAGAASGLVNTAHQLGMAVGLAVLVAISAGAVDLTAQTRTALTAGCGLLVLCLVTVVATIVPGHRRAMRRPDAGGATVTTQVADPVP